MKRAKEKLKRAREQESGKEAQREGGGKGQDEREGECFVGVRVWERRIRRGPVKSLSVPLTLFVSPAVSLYT